MVLQQCRTKVACDDFGSLEVAIVASDPDPLRAAVLVSCEVFRARRQLGVRASTATAMSRRNNGGAVREAAEGIDFEALNVRHTTAAPWDPKDDLRRHSVACEPGTSAAPRADAAGEKTGQPSA